jgi:hypothetical protein
MPGPFIEPNSTPCPRCGVPVGWGRMTPFGRYDEASALLNHIDTDHEGLPS